MGEVFLLVQLILSSMMLGSDDHRFTLKNIVKNTFTLPRAHQYYTVVLGSCNEVQVRSLIHLTTEHTSYLGVGIALALVFSFF
jgi:hypothetical protein